MHAWKILAKCLLLILASLTHIFLLQAHLHLLIFHSALNTTNLLSPSPFREFFLAPDFLAADRYKRDDNRNKI